MAPVCVFDVNETLLDLAALDGEFERLFGDRGVRVTWFGQLLQSAMVATITGRYRDFGAVGLAALTNSTERVARAQLEYAGVIQAFEAVLSADAVRRLKPAPEPYRMAADRLGVEPGAGRLLA
jgi:2-haloacid dehalogenase